MRGPGTRSTATALAVLALLAFTAPAASGRGGPPPDRDRPEAPGRPPAAGGQDPASGDWRAVAPGIAGTARYEDGEWIQQDFVYDDDRRADNAADVVEVRVRAEGEDLLARVTLNTWRGDDAPVIGLALAAPTDDEARDWPFGAGVASPWRRFVTITAESAWLSTPGADAAVALDAPTTDLDANTAQVRIPGAAPDDGTLRIGGGAGVWDADRQAWDQGVIDLAVVDREQEATEDTWRNDRQAAAIDDGDVSAFHRDLDLARLRAGETDPPFSEPGVHVGVFPSGQDLGGGYGETGGSGQGPSFPLYDYQRQDMAFPAYRGSHQPYTVSVPEGYHPDHPAPLTLVLHSLSQDHGQYSQYPFLFSSVYQHVGDDLDAIAITPLALGVDGWYWDEALVDTLEAWAHATTVFSVDDDRVTASGYSMGGYGAYRLATLLPDLLAAGVSWVGPPAYQLWAHPAPPVSDDMAGRAAAGNTREQLENAAHVPLFVVHGALDELVPVSGVTHQAERLRELGHEYRYALHPAADHLSFGAHDDWTREREWLRDRWRVTAPGEVTFKVRPHSWVTHTRDAAERDRLHATLEGAVADLGGDLDGAYWVEGVVPAGAGDVTGEVTLVSHGIADRVPTLTERLALAVPGPTPHLLTGQDRGWGRAAADNVLSGELSQVEELTVDLDEAGLVLDGLELDVEVDRPVTLHLVAGDRRATVELG